MDIINNYYKLQPITLEYTNLLQDLFNSISYIHKINDPLWSKDAIAAIQNPNLPKNGKIENIRQYCVINEKNDSLINYTECYLGFRSDPIVYVADFYIHKKYQRKGIGKIILNEVEKIWKLEGMSKVYLNVYVTNLIGIQFWIKNGYSKINGLIAPTSHDKYEDAMLRLEKDL